IYSYGEGARKDDYQAAKWYLKAANQGDARSQYNLGMMHLNSIGAPHRIGARRNIVIAKKYFIKACENGYQLGCKNSNISDLSYAE
uniref:tetratricopeptide repeat protein n=1 Tax=Psychrobacter sp. UBA3483 TaxID=1947351 RepID=UPI0039C8D8D2